MAYNENDVLALVKSRLTRMQGASPMDDYLKARIAGAARKLEKNGIHLIESDAADTMLLVDMTVWDYQNRDKPDATPRWLEAAKRDRWLSDNRQEVAAT